MLRAGGKEAHMGHGLSRIHCSCKVFRSLQLPTGLPRKLESALLYSLEEMLAVHCGREDAILTGIKPDHFPS